MHYQGEQLRQLLALIRIPGMGPARLTRILNNNPELNGVFDVHGQCQIIPGSANWQQVDRDLAWLDTPNCHMITKEEADYPALLKEIQSAPPVLFVRGNVKLLSRPQIAMVGSRNPTPVGCETALKFAQHFSEKGFTVTSGLALGIDGAAHKGALLGRGSTVAVQGCGLDCIYPPSHQSLAKDIAERGALVSEFSTGVPPLASHFPRRNRTISGLSVGVLVVEATLKSGSLITAKLALEQGREVFAIPGSIHSPLSKGSNALIREGAKLVETADHVLEELGALMRYVIRPQEQGVSMGGSPLDGKYEKLLDQVGYECTPIDSVVIRSGLTAQAVSSMLLELELKGYVASMPGGYARLLA